VLGGAPGIFSARWSGRHGDDRANLDLLLAQVEDVKDEHRGAAFVCAAVLALPDGTIRATEGRMAGSLAHEAKGANGFGYDPVLVVEGDTRHAAELSPDEKNAISHRGRAFRAMVPHLRELLG
jgi:XTP/dITP diphosphohydrolase